MDLSTIESLFNSASNHFRAGRLKQAQTECERLLAAAPGHSGALQLLGVTLHRMGHREKQALALVLKAIEIDPSVPEFHTNLGLIFVDLRRREEAVNAFQNAVRLRPNYPTACNYLGTALREVGRFEEAVAAYRRAVTDKPDYSAAWNNLGNVLHDVQRFAEAEEACRRAVQIEPLAASGHNNLANALSRQDRVEEAIEEYRRAVELAPNNVEARGNLGTALKDMGRVDEAIEIYRQALELNPNRSLVRSNYLYYQHYSSQFDPIRLLKEAHRWERKLEPSVSSIHPSHTAACEIDKKLVIGYVSPDFRIHAVSAFFMPLLRNHDHSQFTIICYSNVKAPDEMTSALRAQADHWRDIAGMADERAAKLIAHDQVDILVDLSGHTAQSRLGIFAMKPAPIQISWLGYPGSTGLSTIDYRITDGYADPPGLTESHFTETLVRLPQTAWCYWPFIPAPGVTFETPALADPSAPICFGSFNNFAKMTDAMFDAWAAILLAVPNSRLFLKAKPLAGEQTCQRVMDHFTRRGIESSRVELTGRTPDATSHLAAYSRVDIALDTFPYHGTTTTCESLYMGVPVVSLAGRSHVSRVGVSLLANVGLPELIAQSPEQYVDIATRLANDRPKLRELRATLRQRMQASPLMNERAFAQNIEAAYRQMWTRFCRRNSRDGNLDEIIDRCRRIIAIDATDAKAHFDLGSALHFRGESDEAIACFEKTLELIPGKAEALGNIAAAMQAKGQVQEAIAVFRRSLEQNPKSPESRFNLGVACLLSGQFREGWARCEARLEMPESLSTPMPFKMPRWDGSDLHRRSILIHAEQGAGDTIQFIRYVPEVVRRGGKVLLVVRRELERLLQGENSQGVEVVSRLVVGSRQFDFRLELMSLPHVLKIDEPLQMPTPYLKAEENDRAKWAAELSQTPGMKIGVVWAGNPTHRGDRLRSMPIQALAPLAEVDATFYSLQVGARSRDVSEAPVPMIDLAPRITDFADTAGLIANLDYLITIDSALAHLAGAMGKPTFVLLPVSPDWRWQCDRSDTPWYPSLKLFRQNAIGEWVETVRRVAEELTERRRRTGQMRGH